MQIGKFSGWNCLIKRQQLQKPASDARRYAGLYEEIAQHTGAARVITRRMPNQLMTIDAAREGLKPFPRTDSAPKSGQISEPDYRNRKSMNRGTPAPAIIP